MKVPNIRTMSYNSRDNGKLISIAQQLVATKQINRIEIIRGTVDSVLHSKEPNIWVSERRYPHGYLRVEKQNNSASSLIVVGSWINKSNDSLKAVYLKVSRRAVETALGILETVDFFDEPAEKAAVASR